MNPRMVFRYLFLYIGAIFAGFFANNILAFFTVLFIGAALILEE